MSNDQSAVSREQFAAEMIKRGLATGHGDTLDDLHRELWWQWDEREKKNVRVPRELLEKVLENLRALEDDEHHWDWVAPAEQFILLKANIARVETLLKS